MKKKNLNDNIGETLTITEKISFNIPVMYSSIIQFDIIEEDKDFENITDFLNTIIKKELLRRSFNLEPIENPTGWFDGTEKNSGVITPIRGLKDYVPRKKKRRFY